MRRGEHPDDGQLYELMHALLEQQKANVEATKPPNNNLAEAGEMSSRSSTKRKRLDEGNGKRSAQEEGRVVETAQKRMSATLTRRIMPMRCHAG